LLQEGGGEADLAEGGEGPDQIVAQDDYGVGEIDFGRSGAEGENAPEGLPADLVLHVVRVRQGSDDNLAVPVVPPPEDSASAVESHVMTRMREEPVSPARKAA
jgi:hypothetical protein